LGNGGDADGDDLQPGETVPISGQYAAVTASGQRVGREVTCVEGEPFPPTQAPAEFGYVLTDATQHAR
jgi:hypothetical protein